MYERNSGNVYLPHPAVAPWVENCIGERAAFPNAAHDVDRMTQALNPQFGGIIYPVPESEIIIAMRCPTTSTKN